MFLVGWFCLVMCVIGCSRCVWMGSCSWCWCIVSSCCCGWVLVVIGWMVLLFGLFDC